MEPSKEQDRLASEVIGASIAVHRHLGPGYFEQVYEDALAVELNARGILFQKQSASSLADKGHAIGKSRADFLIEENLSWN